MTTMTATTIAPIAMKVFRRRGGAAGAAGEETNGGTPEPGGVESDPDVHGAAAAVPIPIGGGTEGAAGPSAVAGVPAVGEGPVPSAPEGGESAADG